MGDRAYAAEFDARFGARALRFVNDTDIVTHVPTPFPIPYEHVGQLRQISADGAISAQPPVLAHFVNAVFGNLGTLKDTMNAVRSGAIGGAPDFLLDHMPRGYTVDIWNDFDARG